LNGDPRAGQEGDVVVVSDSRSGMPWSPQRGTPKRNILGWMNECLKFDPHPLLSSGPLVDEVQLALKGQERYPQRLGHPRKRHHRGSATMKRE
jgi:hypothetical protein